MKKTINKPEGFVEETMDDIVLACRGRLRLLNEDKRILLSNITVQKGKVGIVTAGGSGHLPVF